MKALRWTTDKESSAYMALRQQQNRLLCLMSKAESWMSEILKKTDVKWTRQARWGYRLFDFWNANLGCAIEVDGQEHKPEYDAYRDEYNFRRSAVVVLRVGNFNERDADMAIEVIKKLDGWKERRKTFGLEDNTKKGRRWMVNLPENRSIHTEYVNAVRGGQKSYDVASRLIMDAVQLMECQEPSLLGHPSSSST